jgi:hypothetical protein
MLLLFQGDCLPTSIRYQSWRQDSWHWNLHQSDHFKNTGENEGKEHNSTTRKWPSRVYCGEAIEKSVFCHNPKAVFSKRCWFTCDNPHEQFVFKMEKLVILFCLCIIPRWNAEITIPISNRNEALATLRPCNLLLRSQWTMRCMGPNNRFAWSQSCEGFVKMATPLYRAQRYDYSIYVSDLPCK